jgi:hypothetical protein
MPVNVTPPAGTTAGSVDTDPITPIGANANIVFQFASGTDNKWKFTGFSIKATGNQPPTTDFFQVTNSLPNKTMTVKDKNGDGKLYSYTLSLTDGTSSFSIDPDIQNDNESDRI